MLKKTALALAAAALLLTACSDSSNDGALSNLTFYVSDGASIYTIKGGDTLNATEKTLTGLNGGSLLYSMDFNPRAAGTVSPPAPATGGTPVVSVGLNGLGSDGQSYSIDPATGTVTVRGTPDTSVSLANKAVEIDYNPRAAAAAAGEGRVYRVTTSTGENYRRQSDSGAKVNGANDGSFFYATADKSAGKSVVVSGVAYTNSGVATTIPATTVAYVIDSQNDVLAVLGGTGVTPIEARNAAGGSCPGATANPDCGQLRTVGALGIDVSAFVGFDIINANTGYVTAFAGGTYNLYSIDLSNGKMTFLTGMNPKIQPVRSFAVMQTPRTP